jgi:N-alpha-acetyltransferase 40
LLLRDPLRHNNTMVKSKQLKLMRKKLDKANKHDNPLRAIVVQDRLPQHPSLHNKSESVVSVEGTDCKVSLPTTAGTDAGSSAVAPASLDNDKDDSMVITTTADAAAAPITPTLCYRYRLDEEELSACLSLFETNMGDLYRNSSWGLDLDKKRAELEHGNAKFLMLRQTSGGGGVANDAVSPASSCDTNNKNRSNDNTGNGRHQDKDGIIAAFCHFRFEHDDDDDPEHAVLYVYEIQVSTKCQCRGYGASLMKTLEAIGRYFALDKVMLTVFVANERAMHFYRDRLGYEIDATCQSDSLSADYEVLSKVLL